MSVACPGLSARLSAPSTPTLPVDVVSARGWIGAPLALASSAPTPSAKHEAKPSYARVGRCARDARRLVRVTGSVPRCKPVNRVYALRKRLGINAVNVDNVRTGKFCRQRR